MDKTKLKIVYNISNRSGKSFWSRVGVAFVNQDGSIDVTLESLPVDGKLHIRDYVPREEDYTIDKENKMSALQKVLRELGFDIVPHQNIKYTKNNIPCLGVKVTKPLTAMGNIFREIIKSDLERGYLNQVVNELQNPKGDVIDNGRGAILYWPDIVWVE